MKCPICHEELQTLIKESFICPKDHGVLITGRNLADKKTEFVDAITAGESDSPAGPIRTRPEEITCPHCAATMHATDYDYSKIVIDSCPKCHYRWLDRGELRKVKEYIPKFSGPDLLSLLELEDKIEALEKSGGLGMDPNPKLPHYTSGIGGAAKSYSAGDSRRTIGFLVGASLYGLISGMIKSKFIRYVAPLFIITIGILAYMIFKQIAAIDWAWFHP